MAVKLLSFDIEKENIEVKLLEKPRFPEITEGSKLEDFLTPKSLQFFSILGFGHDWLSASPDTWGPGNLTLTSSLPTLLLRV